MVMEYGRQELDSIFFKNVKLLVEGSDNTSCSLVSAVTLSIISVLVDSLINLRSACSLRCEGAQLLAIQVYSSPFPLRSCWSKTSREAKPTFTWGFFFNGVYSIKWRLTDRYLRWGTLADPRPSRGRGDQCKSSEFLQELRISGFPRLSPTCFRAT